MATKTTISDFRMAEARQEINLTYVGLWVYPGTLKMGQTACSDVKIQ